LIQLQLQLEIPLSGQTL